MRALLVGHTSHLIDGGIEARSGRILEDAHFDFCRKFHTQTFNVSSANLTAFYRHFFRGGGGDGSIKTSPWRRFLCLWGRKREDGPCKKKSVPRDEREGGSSSFLSHLSWSS